MTLKTLEITVVGAGITGLWQAYTLAYRGHAVRLVELAPVPFSNAASRYAGAMLAPFCERESAEPIIQELGQRAIDIWESRYPAVVRNGTLVVAQPRDRRELLRFASRTEGHVRLGVEQLAELEPDLGARFAEGLFYAGEAHVEPGGAMAFLLNRIRRLGVEVTFGRASTVAETGYVVDCRGYAAKGDLASLRGVRGERIVVQSSEINLSRAVRLLHPRFPLYVVPWGAGMHVVGATVLETEDAGPVTLHSALDLLAMAYTLHPAFGEARVVAFDAGVRPAFRDNIPKIVVRDRHILVNGLYRHGFLLAPVLAELVADFLESGATIDGMFVEGAAARI